MFADNKFRYETLGDDSNKRFLGVFDGMQALYYDSENKNADITRLQEYSGFFLFDPRNMGLTTRYFAHYTLAVCLGYKGCREAKTIGPESIHGIQTWHVRVLDAYGQQLDFWIEPKRLPNNWLMRSRRFGTA